jgi:hypothetical protein
MDRPEAMNTPTDIIRKHPCGCMSLAVQNAVGETFVILSCAHHRDRGIGWRSEYVMDHLPAEATDIGMSLACLDALMRLIRDGWKYRKIRELLEQ